MSSKKHDAVFDDVLSGLEAAPARSAVQGGARFLKRTTALGDRMSGEREEKLLHWVDPASCRMWARHNREYDLLSEENCRELIDGIRAQGQQEFPAIVRRLSGEDHAYEVICGARRHFAISWLRANNFPQFRYLVEVRDLTDEEAFRLADIENRDREDISDYERARDYAQAIGLYYGGRQKAMAARLDVSEAWLSRYLGLARIPEEIVAAFPSLRDIRELHARTLKPLLADPARRPALLREAADLAAEQQRARRGERAPIDALGVMNRLKRAGAPAPAANAVTGKNREAGGKRVFGPKGELVCRQRRNVLHLELSASVSRTEAETALQAFLDATFSPA